LTAFLDSQNGLNSKVLCRWS